METPSPKWEYLGIEYLDFNDQYNINHAGNSKKYQCFGCACICINWLFIPVDPKFQDPPVKCTKRYLSKRSYNAN